MCMAYEFRTFRLRNRWHGAATALALWRRFLADRDGATIAVIGIAMPVLIGAMGLAAEISYWHLHQRAMQNAADAAVMAAATAGGSDYAAAVKAVASQYGFTDGSGQIAVAMSNPATAPGCAAKCYTVTISDTVPLTLSRVVGFRGNAAIDGRAMNSMTATAVATSGAAYSYCVLALAGSGQPGLTSNGAPNANLNGCNTMSNTSATCHGHNLNASIGNAAGTNSGCGNTQNSNVPAVADPYSGLAAYIPANTCSSYPQEPVHRHDPALPESNQWIGTVTLSGNNIVCGDQQLTGSTTINAPNGAVLVIENGQLDTNGYTLRTASGSALTIVFSGTNPGSYQHIPTGGGTLDIAAPTSGNWSGVAIYQDPALTRNVDISAAGNSPTWNISGLVYLPHSTVTLSGAVNKSGYGASCFVLVVDNLTVNGTGSIFSNNTQCASGGLSAPQGGSRGMLVN